MLKVRPLKKGDFEQLYEAASDPLIWDLHPFPRYERAAFTEFFDAAVESKSGVVIIDQKSESVVGTSRFYNLKEKECVFIGYTFLVRSHWGGVFNQELKALMLDHAFQYVDQVFFDIGETNLRSRRAIEKIGAKFIKLQLLKGKPYTLYGIDKSAFRK